MRNLLKLICALCLFTSTAKAVVPLPGTNYLFMELWDFADTTNWTTFLNYPPISFTNLSSVPVGNGNALVIDSTNAAWVNYNLYESDGWTNLTLSEGSVMSWFAPAWSGTNAGGNGPGVWGRLIETGTYTTNASSGWWSLYFDPAGTNLIFSAQTNNGIGTNYLIAPVRWTNAQWHHFALTYSATNTLLYIDGALATNGPGMTIWPSTNSLTNGVYIGSDVTGIAQAHGAISTLSTYSTVLDSNTINAEFVLSSIFYNYGSPGFALVTSAPSTPVFTPTFEAITGSGYLSFATNAPNCQTNSNVWLTNVTAHLATNHSISVTFTIAGGSNGIPYDVFASTYLTGTNPGAAQWSWMGQGNHCMTYTLTNMPTNACFLILGTPQDSDFDGLTDAYELLVSKTDPNNPDTDGDGLGDGWEVVYGFNPNNASTGTNGLSDGYLEDSSQDGWNNIQKSAMGLSAGTWVTPPAPTGLRAVISSSGTNVILTWNPSFGSVLNYTIVRQDDQSGLGFVILATVAASVTTYTDVSPPIANGLQYRIYANFSGGTSPPSASADPSVDPRLTVAAQVIRGPQGRAYLITSAMPDGLASIRINVNPAPWTNEVASYPGTYSINWFWQGLTDFEPRGSGHFDIALTNITNGMYQIPYSNLPPFGAYALSTQGVGNGGKTGNPNDVQFFFDQRPYNPLHPYANYGGYAPFVDGTTQIQQNVAFLLHSASAFTEFFLDTYLPGTSFFYEYDAATNYVYSGFYDPKSATVYELQPFEENYIYANFAYAPGNVGTNGLITTGADVGYPRTLVYPASLFNTLAYATNGTAPAITGTLTGTNGEWLFYNWSDDIEDSLIAYPNTVLSTYQNIYGLGLNSIKYFDSTSRTFKTAHPGDVIPANFFNYDLFVDLVQPVLHTDSYYFGRPGVESLPADADFQITNTTPPLLLATVGQTFLITAWAKQSLSNGYAGVFAFPQQYFDKAFMCDASGTITTNQTGILSEYGEFFPTEPGKIILMTKPDGATGSTGQCTVYAIKLQLDVNHDGTMDTSFAVPDNTSPSRPFQFWVNNNFDRYTLDTDNTNSYDDDVRVAFSPYTNAPTPDFEYRTAITGHRVIPNLRDLTDFSRLWIAGVNSNFFTALPTNSTITLSWGDVGSPNYANPTIDLFRAADADGGIGYLTNSTTGSNQINSLSVPYVGRLSPGGSIQLTPCEFGTCWWGFHYIWCGVTNGSGTLTLTIADSSGTTLAQAVAYIQITDIKQMYERWTIGDGPSLSPTTNAVLATEGMPAYIPAFQYNYEPSTDTNTPYILFVHGWNMETWLKDRWAETAFKQLFWQGYQGRFGSFRWPTRNGFLTTTWQLITDSLNYDTSERVAWNSGAGLMNKLGNLNSNYPGQVYVLAHSMGNVVAGEALRLAGSNQLVNTYVASQAAIPAHVYDGTSTNLIDYTQKPSAYPFSVLGHPIMPNIYSNRLASTSAAASRRINYFNTNDYALSPFAWCFDQILKPHNMLAETLKYTGTTNDAAPWNNFYESFNDGPFLHLDIVTNLSDRYTVFAGAAQPYSRAMGTTPNLANITVGVDLTAIWITDPASNSFRDHFWHSAQFRGDSWQAWTYWNTLLRNTTIGFDIRN